MNKDTRAGPLMASTQICQRVGIAADHGGYELKEYLAKKLREAGYEVVGFGDREPNVNDDYPDYVVPLACAVGSGEVARGVAICGSGLSRSGAAGKDKC